MQGSRNTPAMRSVTPSELKASDLVPMRILDVEISQPLPPVPAVDAATGKTYKRALALVRLHTQPLGVVELRLDDDTASSAAGVHADQIWQALQEQIAEHVRNDGLQEPVALTAAGLDGGANPACVREREVFLARAPFVSIIVATHNRPAGLAACLRSLLSLHYPRYEIVVVDNAAGAGGADDVVGRAQASSDQVRIRYLREDRPGGAWAHNRGLLNVDAPIVAFTDDDVVVDRYWLAELVKGFEAAANVACVTGLIFPIELETQAQVWIEEYGGFSKGFSRRIFDLAAHHPPNPLYPYTPGAFGSGANMAFRTSILRDIGGFDTILGAGSMALGGDDIASFFQVVAQGYTLVYEPAAVVRHLHYREYSQLRKQVYGYGVGLTAVLTKCIVEKPSRIFEIAARVPAGLTYVFSPHSHKNAQKRADYPRELTTLERKGMLYGPIAYMRGRRQARRMGWRSPLAQPAAPCVSPASQTEELPRL